jgi:hypothetical protein
MPLRGLLHASMDSPLLSELELYPSNMLPCTKYQANNPQDEAYPAWSRPRYFLQAPRRGA